MDDIVARLRELSERENFPYIMRCCFDAADEIEQLRTEREYSQNILNKIWVLLNNG